MAISKLCPVSPCGFSTGELLTIGFSDGGEEDVQYDDVVNLENENDNNINIFFPEEGIGGHVTWEIGTPAMYEANLTNYTQDTASGVSDVEKVSPSDTEDETELPVCDPFGYEEAQMAMIQSGLAIPSGINLVLEELVSIRAMLAKIQAQIRPLSSAKKPKAIPQSAKRKRNPPPTPLLKRQRKAREVNIKATRAWLQFDDEPESLEYIWQYGRGGDRGCWIRKFGPESEKVDGEYLLSYGSDLCVQIRANGDWLPVTVQWNNETDTFEGLDTLDGKMFEVDEVNMMDAMCGVVGNHVGHVF
ncbi:hypothetical protein PGQ11_010207 [Apiospora arundinis]|uniref:Uncharacterized protein n=1 Tax=Apiospora arundinis TaxID=335852 RepID=A0ABR2I8Y8_9PEZI